MQSGKMVETRFLHFSYFWRLKGEQRDGAGSNLYSRLHQKTCTLCPPRQRADTRRCNYKEPHNLHTLVILAAVRL